MENSDQISARLPSTETALTVINDRHHVDLPAIFGGAVVAVAIGILATGFGAALGLTAISANSGESSGLLAIIMPTVWIMLSVIGAYATGGYITGRMRRRVDSASREEVTVRDGMNGLIVWGLGIAFSAMLLGSAIGTTVAAVGNVVAATGTTASQLAGGVATGAMSATAALLPSSAKSDPMAFITGSMLRPTVVQLEPATADATAADAASILGNLANSGEVSDLDRAYLVQLTVARSGLAEPEASQRVEAAVAATQAVRDKAIAAAADAEKVARDTAETARISAILTAFFLTAISLVSGVAAYIAAVKGGRHRDEGRIFGGFAYRK